MNKKVLIIGILLTTLVAGTLVLTGCGCSNNSKQNNSTAANTSANASNATNNATQNATNNGANNAQSASMVGDYKLVEKTDDGVTFNEQQLSANGKAETLKVNADGTSVKTEQDGDTDTYTYDNANFKGKDGDLKAYTFDNNTIRITERDGDTKVFQKI